MKPSLSVKATLGAQVDLEVKERLVDLAEHYKMSMAAVISNLVNVRYQSLFGTESTIDECLHHPDGSKGIVLSISRADYNAIVRTFKDVRDEFETQDEYVTTMIKNQVDTLLEYYRQVIYEIKGEKAPPKNRL